MTMTINEKRREIQIEAVEALERNGFNGFVKLPTGTGKAWVLIESLKRINPETVWYVCDSEDNRDVTFKNELKNWGAEEWIDKIEFMCYQSACKRSGEHKDLILADEADFGLTPIYSRTFTQNTFKHKILTSGTVDKNKMALLKTIVPIVYEISIQDVVDTGVLNGANFFLVNYMLSRSENDEYLHFNRKFASLLKRDMGYSVQKDLQWLQFERKQFLSTLTSSKNICRKLINNLYKIEDNKMLVFCGATEQADSICQYSYHTKNKNNYLDDFDKDVIRVLSVVSKADRGLNLKGVNNIIMEAPVKSSTKFFQRSGRGRRLSVDEKVDIYFLIPYYRFMGTVQPTIVHRWVMESTQKLNFKPEIYKF